MGRLKRLTLRDLFWLTLLIALGFAWRLEDGAADRLERELVGKQGYFYTANAQRAAVAAAAEQRSDAELWELVESPRWSNAVMEKDVCFLEFVRRGRRDLLQGLWEKSAKKQDAALLTALRRAEGRPDPLRVRAELFQKTLRGSHVDVAEVGIEIENVDPEETLLTEGRGGISITRQGRWTLVLADAAGRTERIADFLHGLRSESYLNHKLRPGEVVKRGRLDPRDYLHPPPTGRYTLRAVHSLQPIADETDLRGIITWQSEPMEVLVTNSYVSPFRFSRTPLVGLVAASIAAGACLVYSQLRRRDLVCLTLLAAVCAGWLLHQRGMAKRIYDATPSESIKWTLSAAGR